MPDAYPPDLRDFVNQKVADGLFRSADEFAVEAASLYRELDQRHQELKQSVQEGIDQLETRDYVEIQGKEALDDFFNRVKDRGRERLKNSASNE